jgi:CHAT domain-containing protein
VHFATHGFADPYDPSSSGLILADAPTGKEDGVLYGFEVLAMKLPAQLIVLSACETGLGKVFPGEGSVSLTRNFMLAGANNVVSSLWQVSDASTQKLMVNFYGQLIQYNGLNYSLALLEAKKKLIREGFAHPYYWSAFLLHGR